MAENFDEGHTEGWVVALEADVNVIVFPPLDGPILFQASEGNDKVGGF